MIKLNLKSAIGRSKGIKIDSIAKKGLSLSAIAALTLTTTPVFAATSGGQIASNLSNQFNSFGALLVNACFLGGVGVAGSGLLEMKKAGSDNNQGRDASHKSGLIKIATGGALCAVPSIANVGIGTIFNGGSGDGAPTQTNLTFTGG